jgi:hypothetical protein
MNCKFIPDPSKVAPSLLTETLAVPESRFGTWHATIVDDM